MKVKAQIKDLEPETLFTWEGHLVTDVERITGPFVPVFLLMMREAPQRGHDAFNAALKHRAESR